VTTTKSKTGSGRNDTKIHDDNKTGQQMQPKTQNINSKATLTMAAQKTVAIRQLQ
jgi:hypothetical protein